MPPELAAATGMHDVTAENTNLGKLDAGQNEPPKGFARVRPPFVCLSLLFGFLHKSVAVLPFLCLYVWIYRTCFSLTC